ncbi:nucleotidyltransferase family protein [Candidatus Methylacidiphilum fumarolicum]|uniref:Nucleoside-diphosphate-sugar pyrophosphorylase n=2 Tax=Candidatus Methylacidiphilum fumarolicum TaxID=591154 RepID=I0K0Y9_METFB|nr:nucleotidyltransferase family protein [Candidatus Methylacidiphilum fumarolicum]MBW6413972.1 nucleotidyltransferase family protein [Candidatus Methylacidiphilum fumarolicum]TFE70514.1 nucleoside-diphosphate-sugar pyrophosphorylase [Candidatus Methylacidiphilum fumarolicum]TFE74768.1 nucleotidyltransferase family protein [Candidatus Methylacidiphilum fumarolicum]TFE76014.1 nucleotidyltransferase family protein [Candidatus Methylacidiphilum fumarolicum]TFE76401.1 nucleoside-diphosphate-sugar 
MRALLLSAGYATRLYPLTLNQPKALLSVAGKPILDYLMDKLFELSSLDEIYVVTNHKFYGHFVEWKHRYTEEALVKFPIVVLDDGSTTEENRLGAIGDIQFTIERMQLQDDLIVLASDNLFCASLTSFVSEAKRKNSPLLGVYNLKDKQLASKYGVVSFDANGKLSYFEEKPQNPPTSWVAMALYFFPKSILSLVKTYLREQKNTDQPGRFIQWLYPQMDVYVWELTGLWFDIGSKETLEAANLAFQ